MAKAQQVKDCDKNPQLAWVDVEDENGKIWKYYRRGNAPPNSQITARATRGANGGRVSLERGGTGTPSLQQVGPGLPPTMVVFLETAAPQAPMPVVASWGGEKVEYVRRAPKTLGELFGLFEDGATITISYAAEGEGKLTPKKTISPDEATATTDWFDCPCTKGGFWILEEVRSALAASQQQLASGQTLAPIRVHPHCKLKSGETLCGKTFILEIDGTLNVAG